jgi:hypothetical protein
MPQRYQRSGLCDRPDEIGRADAQAGLDAVKVSLLPPPRSPDAAMA